MHHNQSHNTLTYATVVFWAAMTRRWLDASSISVAMRRRSSASVADAAVALFSESRSCCRHTATRGESSKAHRNLQDR